jgi:hypothetical protein
MGQPLMEMERTVVIQRVVMQVLLKAILPLFHPVLPWSVIQRFRTSIPIGPRVLRRFMFRRLWMEMSPIAPDVMEIAITESLAELPVLRATRMELLIQVIGRQVMVTVVIIQGCTLPFHWIRIAPVVTAAL